MSSEFPFADVMHTFNIVYLWFFLICGLFSLHFIVLSRKQAELMVLWATACTGAHSPRLFVCATVVVGGRSVTVAGTGARVVQGERSGHSLGLNAARSVQTQGSVSG